MLHNAGTWHRLTSKQEAWVDKVRINLWRSELGWHNAGKDPEHRHSNAEVWQKVQQCSSRMLVTMARLRQFARVVRHAPSFLRALIQVSADFPDSWAASVREDLCTLWAWHRRHGAGTLADMEDPTESPHTWAAVAAGSPALWKSSVARLAAEVYVPTTLIPLERELHEQGVCFDCGACFDTRAALFGHRARVHRYRNPLRRKIAGSTCQRCLFDFWTRERLFYHVKKAVRCGTFYEDHVLDLPTDQQEQLDCDAARTQRSNLRAGMTPRHALHPPVRCQGPLPLNAGRR